MRVPIQSRVSILFSVVLLTLGMPDRGFCGAPPPEKEKRPTSLYAGVSFGQDEYRAQDLSAQIGVNDFFSLPLGVSRSTNAFTEASTSFYVGGDWDLKANLTPRAVLNFYQEPNSVIGLGISLSNRFHLEGLWKGKRSSVLTAGIEGTRYSERETSSTSTGGSSFSNSRKGRGRGRSSSTRLSTGVIQTAAWLSWNHSLSDSWGLSSSAQKYFYLGAAPVDGNAAISDRPFVPSQAQLLVDGFPEWTADFGASTWFESWDIGSRVALSQARNSSSGVIVAPSVNAGWSVTEILSLGTTVSYTIQSSSTLVSLNAEWVW